MHTRSFAAWAGLALAASFGIAPAQSPTAPESTKPMAATGKVHLMTLDPGHYHAALVQKNMYDQVDEVVHVYAPAGLDLDEHLKKIQGFNTRPDNPTRWDERVYTEPDFLEKMLRDRPGNVVVLAGNNTRKTEYISACVKAGLNVLADKPMAINPAQYRLLLEAFKIAEEKHLLLYDIMTERHEITNILQRELSMTPAVFGELQTGTAQQPAVTKESVHHFSKEVAGKPLKRPTWFFDVNQEGEGIVDVSTHLVDLVQWECFPEQVLAPDDAKVLSARRWSTPVTLEQFKKVTGANRYPDFLGKDVREGVLNVYGNGEFTYTLKGRVAKVSVTWKFEAPEGGGDTHYSIMRGSKASLIIEQGREQGYRPVLYVENASGAPDAAFEQALRAALDQINARLASAALDRPPNQAPASPGSPSREADRGELRVTLKKRAANWEIAIPDALRTNHEQHFCQVTEKYLGFLAEGRMPPWEVPNMIVKYHTIMEAYRASR